MTMKRFTFKIKTQGNKAYTQWYDENMKINSAETLCELLNNLADENKRLKQQLKEEQCRTRPITLNTHISDEDFKRIELLFKKHLGEIE